ALDIELILTRCRSFVGNACEQVRDTAYEGRKQWCGERIRLYHRGNQCKLRILSAEDLKTTLAPIDDPVLVDAAPGVELELRFAVTLFVGYAPRQHFDDQLDRKSTRLNSSHEWISYAVFCLIKKNVASVS